jgi:hypothetical protein
MKKIILFLMEGFIVNSTLSQTRPIKQIGYEIDYMELSRKQKNIASIMLGGGVVLIIAPTLILLNSQLSDNNLSQKFSFGLGLITIGGLSVLGSIPVFISAAKNKGRALSGSAGFKMESLPSIVNSQAVSKPYPAISFKINL